MSQSASHFADQLMGISARTVLDDWTSTLFGYKKRPKRGALFNRFLSDSKRISETFLIREFFLSSCSSGLVSLPDSCSKDFCLKVGKHIIQSLMSIEGMKKAFQFSSLKEATDYLSEGLNSYIEGNYDNFTTVFFKRAQIYTETHLNAGWLVSIARLVTDNHSPLCIIRQATKEKFSSEFFDDLSA